MKQTLAIILMITILSNCAPFPDSITPMTVSVHKYSNLTCDQLHKELRQIELREKQLRSKQQYRATSDCIFVTVILCVFWPALIIWPIMANMNKDKSEELAQLRGNCEAIKDVQISQKCLGPITYEEIIK